jgi:hypothetical protein
VDEEALGREEAVIVLPAGKVWLTCTTVVKFMPLEDDLGARLGNEVFPNVNVCLHHA